MLHACSAHAACACHSPYHVAAEGPQCCRLQPDPLNKAAAATVEIAEPTEAVVAAQVAADEAGKTTQAQQIAELQRELLRQQVRTSARPRSTDSTLG